MTLRLNRWALAAATLIALVAFFGAGGAFGYLYAQDRLPIASGTRAQIPSDVGGAKAPSDEELWKPVMQTYDLIKKEYYGRPVDRQKLVQDAAQGMMKGLKDPYSSFLPPQQEKMVQDDMKGRFEGIGVYVDVNPKTKEFTIITPIEGSPAEKAKLRRGDVIVAVNGESIVGKDQEEVITKIRGPKGTSVRLRIKRAGRAPFEVDVLRDEVQVQQVTYELKKGGIAYIDANIFGDKTTRELDEALRNAKRDGAKGIVLDLRDNGGGWVTAAREMVGRFIPNGPAMYEDRTQGPGGETPLNVAAKDLGAYETPLVVLVNKGSASASEIVSGALQARGRAKLIGETTFGKGSEQSVHSLEGGSSAHITIAHWLTPDKRDIHGKGLKPDVAVKTTLKDREDAGPQFEKAVEEVRGASE